MDDLNAAVGSVPDVCLAYYALGTLQTTLDQGLSNYTAVNDGYDDAFGYYVSATLGHARSISVLCSGGRLVGSYMSNILHCPLAVKATMTNQSRCCSKNTSKI